MHGYYSNTFVRTFVTFIRMKVKKYINTTFKSYYEGKKYDMIVMLSYDMISYDMIIFLSQRQPRYG